MKFTLKFDIQEDQESGRIDVTLQVMKGAATVDTIELEDTTANLTCFYARRSVEDLFREMADARRNDRANAGEVHAASEGSEDEG